MNNTIKQLHTIIDYFEEFERRVRLHNTVGLQDINILSQKFCNGLLNIFFAKEKYKFEVLDLIKHNYPAIDLGDFRKKVAYQVTYQDDMKKIHDTIEKFSLTTDFKKKRITTLRFLLLNNVSLSNTQAKNCEKKYKEKKLKFDSDESILTFETIVKKVKHLDDAHLEKLIKFFEKEFGVKDPKADLKLELDRMVFKKLDKLIDENEVNHLYQGLYGGDRYNVVELIDQHVEPYTACAANSSSEFFDQVIRDAHYRFLKSLNELRNFLTKHYSSNSGAEELYVFKNDLIARDNLNEKLNDILQSANSHYKEYRTLVRRTLLL